MSFEQLETLMGSYYHQDWVEIGLWQTLDLYVSDSTPSDLALLVHEIDQVLSTSDESEVAALMSTYYCAVSVSTKDGGYRGWLAEIAQRVGSVR